MIVKPFWLFGADVASPPPWIRIARHLVQHRISSSSFTLSEIQSSSKSFSWHDNYHAREERLETKGARKEEGGEVIVRLIAKSFPCRYTTMAKDSKDDERLKERRTQHSKGTRKVIRQDFPSCTCLSKRHCPVDESTMNCIKSQ